MLNNKENELKRKVGNCRKRCASSQHPGDSTYNTGDLNCSKRREPHNRNVREHTNQSHDKCRNIRNMEIDCKEEIDASTDPCNGAYEYVPVTSTASLCEPTKCRTDSVWFTSSFQKAETGCISEKGDIKKSIDEDSLVLCISSKQHGVENGRCFVEGDRNDHKDKQEKGAQASSMTNTKTSTPKKKQTSSSNYNKEKCTESSLLDNSDTIMADMDLCRLAETVTESSNEDVNSSVKNENVNNRNSHLNDSLEDLFEESFRSEDFLTHLDRIEIHDNGDRNLHCMKDGHVLVSSNLCRKTEKTPKSSHCGKENEDRNEILHRNTANNNASEISADRSGTSSNLVKTIDVKTPIASLRDRIKRKLHANAGSKNMQSPGQLMASLRKEVVEKAQSEAEVLQSKGGDCDIGPFYGLPSKVQQLFQHQRGIDKLYEWQKECLQLPAIQEGRNLIYSLPTSGGKTLVAEILILRQLLCKKNDALLVLPFVSIVQEKVRIISQLAAELDFLVEEYAGSKGRFPPTKGREKRSLYIATIEKGHSLINSLLEQERMDSLGLVIIDELHMIGEGGSRGATLESLLLKVIHADKSTQIIGMSATLNNIQDIQKFLHAEVFSNDFRPVKLTEFVKLEDNIYELQSKMQLEHNRVVTFEYTAEMTRCDPDHLLGLVTEVIPDNSCLIFCPTKKNCENVAMMLCKLMVKHKRELSSMKKLERKALLKELYSDGDHKICPVLQYTVHFGVAYHHSGLTTDERRLIEDAYADGVLCLLTCTSTLAAGVNLPAKRVILRSPYVATNFISRSQYKQMSGRAGRAGIDSSGESILITKAKDKEKVLELLTRPMGQCLSSLNHDNGKGIRGLLLSTIGLGITKTIEDAFHLMEKTLLSVQSSQLCCDVVNVTKDSLQQLLDMGLVVQKKLDSDHSGLCIEVTPLGKATFKGSVDIDHSAKLYKDLKKAEESLVLVSHLHLLYLVTPYDVVSTVQPPWMTYFQQMSTLSAVELKVAELIGVPESYIAKKASGQATRQVVDDMVIKRFYLTLMLYDLWRQKSIWEVSEKFDQPRGFIQNLLSSAASFAACVFHFCQELSEFWAFQDLLGNFVKRLSYCVSAELIPLIEIPGVKLGRAKQLYSAGFKTLPQVANADPKAIVGAIQLITNKAAKQIVASAKVLLNEKAEALREEVEELVSVPNQAGDLTISTKPTSENTLME